MKNKVLVLGIDGLDPILIKKWQKSLPNLNKFIQNGVYGYLRSSIPPVSSPAWNWFTTGCQGGKTNIFYFIEFKKDYSEYPKTQVDSKIKPFWQFLPKKISVGIVNLPLTYPIEKIKNGFIIPGFPTNLDCQKQNFSYPVKISKQIKKITNNNYTIGIGDQIGHSLLTDYQYLKKTKKILAMKTKVFKFLIKKYKPDLGIFVYTSIDRASHRLWHNKELKKLYIKQDKEIGHTLKAAHKIYPYIFILSDHGFQQVKTIFYINNWLKKHGLLNKTNINKLEKIYTLSIKIMPSAVLKKLVNLLPCKLKNKLPRSCYFSLKQNLNWNKTNAFSLATANHILLYINDSRFDQAIVSKTEKEKIISYLIKNLKTITNPFDKQKIVKKIYKQKDIYKGPYTKNGPDLIIALNKGVFADNSLQSKFVYLKLEKNSRRSGDHSEYGFFAAKGPGFKKNQKLTNLNILDIAPTILSLFNVKKPKYYDGNTLIKNL